MDNKKKTDSIMRYVVYLLCGVLLAGYSLLKWNAMSEMKYLYLAIGVIWVIYGGVRALVLARRQKATGNLFSLADLTLDASRHLAVRAGEELRLTSREYAILEYLIRNAGMVLSRDRILENVWSMDYEGASNMVDVYIRSLRKKVDDPFEKKLIHTVRGVGYVLREQE